MLIVNAKIVSMSDRLKRPDGSKNIVTFENGYIHIEGKIIKATGPMENCPHDADIIDAKGRYVMPGFVDAHTHIGFFEDSVGFEGDDGNEATDPVTPQLRAIDGIYHADRSFDEARQWGVTTVVCGPGSSNVICGQFAALLLF
jgi:imidazolonepropionase-like amidohydrolase